MWPLSRTARKHSQAREGLRAEPQAGLKVRALHWSSILALLISVPSRSAVTLAGWALLAFLAYQVATSTVESKIYNPFEILGLRSVRSTWHFLSITAFISCTCYCAELIREGDSLPLQEAVSPIVRLPVCLTAIDTTNPWHSHPDKVKISGNDTAESVATRFVDFTKAYKACVSRLFVLTRTDGHFPTQGLRTKPFARTC